MKISQQYAEKLHELKKNIIKCLNGLPLTKLKNEFSHEIVIPNASYAPWVDDKKFIEICEAVEGKTLIDVYRLYELWYLSNSLADLAGDCLEVGVWKGGSAVVLGESMKDQRAKLWLADTFSGVPKSTSGKDSLYRGGEHADTSAEDVERLLLDNGITNYRLLKGLFPIETAESLADKSFRLVHIDVDTYESAEGVFRWVYPRLCVGGVVVFDDYGFWGCEGVTAFVNELRKEGLFLIHNLNGHALVLKRW